MHPNAIKPVQNLLKNKVVTFIRKTFNLNTNNSQSQ